MAQHPSQKGFAQFAVKNPHFILVICILLIILGSLSYNLLPKDLLPAVKMPAVQILSFYPGMPVEHVENNLTARFELYTGQAIGITKQESRSLNGVSIVRNYFSEDVDLNTAIAQTTSLVMSVLRRLPPGTQPPLIMPFDPTASVPIALVAVSGDKSEKELYDFARYNVINAVQTVNGAMAPTVMGGSERQVVIDLDRDKLAKYNMSPLEVLNRINELNTFIPSGSVKLGDQEFQITSNGLVDSIDEMNSFPLRAEFGETVPLNKVGRALDSHKIQTNYVLIDGKPQVYVPVYRQPGSNTIKVVDEVRASIKKLGETTDHLKLQIVGDQSGFVKKAIESISEEAVIGGGMAALLVLIFLGSFRATVAIALTIPLSFLFAFMGLKAMGQSLNAMTLGGLALAVGVLVDNSIVVIENIFHHIEHKMDPLEAALIGAQEVAVPVLISTLCTLIVFTPVIFLQGLIKYLFAALALAVILAMVASYFISMTLIPLYSYRFIKEVSHGSKINQAINQIMHKITKVYGKTIEYLLTKKVIVLGIVIVVISAAVLSGPFVGTELFPKADAGSFIMELRMKSGTRIENTTAVAKEIDKKIHQWIPEKDLQTVLVNVGVYYGYPAAFTPNSGSQDMFFNIQLTDERSQTSQYYAEELRKHLQTDYPGLDYGFQLGGLLSSALNAGLKAPIDINIQGPDKKIELQIAENLKTEIAKIKGARDVRVQERLDTPQIQINVNRQLSAEMGITTDEVIKNVVSAVSNSSSFNSAIWVDPKSGIDYLLGVQFNEKEFNTISDLLHIPITGRKQGRTVTLDKLVKLERTQGPTEINHTDLKPMFNLYVNVMDRDIGSVSHDIEKVIAAQKIPTHYEVKVQGEYAEMNKSLSVVGGGFVLAVILVYLLLVIQFRSWTIPLIIISAVPLGVCGLIVSFYITNTYFSIQAAIGAIFLIGIGVSNSVLLVEFILKRVNQGAVLKTAIIEGAQARFRPIIMTALAAIMGLVPMAIGLGKGSEANIPLGRAVVGGELIGVPLILIVVPILFYVFVPKKYIVSEEII